MKTKKKLTASDIHHKCGHWLAEANEAGEKGNSKREELCLKKAQYWLDRLNQIEGYND